MFAFYLRTFNWTQDEELHKECENVGFIYMPLDEKNLHSFNDILERKM